MSTLYAQICVPIRTSKILVNIYKYRVFGRQSTNFSEQESSLTVYEKCLDIHTSKIHSIRENAKKKNE